MLLHRHTACPWHVLVADVSLETRISIPARVEHKIHMEEFSITYWHAVGAIVL